MKVPDYHRNHIHAFRLYEDDTRMMLLSIAELAFGIQPNL